MTRLLLAWARLALPIARSAPVWNIRHIERLRRREYQLEMKQ